MKKREEKKIKITQDDDNSLLTHKLPGMSHTQPAASIPAPGIRPGRSLEHKRKLTASHPWGPRWAQGDRGL